MARTIRSAICHAFRLFSFCSCKGPYLAGLFPLLSLNYRRKKKPLYEIVAEKYKQNLRTVIQFYNILCFMLIKVYPMKQNVIKCNSLNKMTDHLVMDDDNKLGYLIMERLNSSFMQ